MESNLKRNLDSSVHSFEWHELTFGETDLNTEASDGSKVFKAPYDFIVASDVIFKLDLVEPLIRTIEKLAGYFFKKMFRHTLTTRLFSVSRLEYHMFCCVWSSWSSVARRIFGIGEKIVCCQNGAKKRLQICWWRLWICNHLEIKIEKNKNINKKKMLGSFFIG